MGAPKPDHRVDAAPALDEVLDQHAQLRDLVAQIREPADPPVLAGLLRRLLGLLEAHFAHEEQSRVLERSERDTGPDVAVELAGEHAQLRDGLRHLSNTADSATDGSIASLRAELESWLQQLERHDLRETRLFGDGSALVPDAGAAPGMTSRALEVNLRRTAVDVVIPAAQRVLLDVTAGRYGIHEGTRKLLREVNHPYVGWGETLQELHRHAMNDLPHYLGSQRAAEAIGVFCSLYTKAAEEAPGLGETAVRYQTFYWEKLLRTAGERTSELLPVLRDAMARLGPALQRSERSAAEASTWLARAVGALVEVAPDPEDPALAEGIALLAVSLGHSYSLWLALEDPALWWRETTGADADAALPAPVAAISHGHLEECRRSLERVRGGDAPLTERARTLLTLPDHARIARGFLEAAARAGEPGASRVPALARIRWLVRMLAVEELAGVHEQVLAEIGRLHGKVVEATEPAEFDRVLRETFDALRHCGLMGSPSAMRLVARLGAATLAADDPERARRAIDEMLRCDFPRPGFTGFGSEWQVRSDPAHLAGIRAYLEVIEANPRLAQPLVAALVVQLSIGGVLITDMDLFHKDVSRLLNSGVEPVYHTVVHLLRLLPVYFSEIGAEGELRDVSSRIDEIGARADPLCHFLRKQCHVESNPLLLDLVEAVARFWESGDPEALRRFLPPALFERVASERESFAGLRAVVRDVIRRGSSDVFELDRAELGARLADCRSGTPLDREKVALLVDLRRVLGDKYELDHVDLLERLEAWHGLDERGLRSLRRALDRGDDERSLAALLSILEKLQGIVLSGQPTEGHEDIYRKRHVAVGIPSVYGRYREEKLEAVGLSFRVESLANVLFERLVSRPEFSCPTRSALREVVRGLHLFLRAVRVDGCRGRGLASGIENLERALEDSRTTVDQYVNIFQLLSRSVEQLVRIRLRAVYEDVLERVIGRMIHRGEISLDPGANPEETVLKISERFLRDRIGEGLGLQQLDRLLGRVLRALVEVREKLDRETADRLISFDTERASLAIDRRSSPLDGIVYLGNKGHQIRRMSKEGLPVPPGFVLTTEVSRSRAALRAWPAVGQQLADRLRRHLRQLERSTGSRYGDARRPLLLSVRSSSALSMPGVLDTFLDVGLNPTLTKGFAARSGSPWCAWDAYRRFIQSWGMAHGLARDSFDALMREAKREYAVLKKAELSPAQMEALALRYRVLVEDHGQSLIDEPFAQLLACVNLVLRSWDSERARAYRTELGVAEDWGMAVIIQSMVFGNLHQRSGTGVVLTCDPQMETRGVSLYGDFVVQSQGDDVVGGLVETFPIRAGQRGPGTKRSLESEFPGIFQALQGHAKHLVGDLGMFHQEIEFTFESEDPRDLYILQTRDTVMADVADVAAFLPGSDLDGAKLATGVGAGGGALSGRVAHTQEEIAGLRRQFPQDAIILLRPDTVPDDIPLILQIDGMVTARGGATSHAALVAQRLGRTCVVGCAALDVDAREGRSKLGGHQFATGDPISINGFDGAVYWGKQVSTNVRRQRLA